MTHNEERSEWWKEGLAAFISGALYGISNAIVGNPFDIVKTKMQVIKEYQNISMIESAKLILRKEGLIGFFRGVTPSMIGSGIYRSIQFAVFESIYTRLENTTHFNRAIPYTLGLETRVILGSFLAGTVRSFIECPFEYSKVRLQVCRSWKISELYKGFYVLWLRTAGISTIYLSTMDSLRRNTSLFKSQIGIFLMSGISSIIAWTCMWPIEIAKNHIQSNNNSEEKILKIIVNRVEERGIINGLYKGTLPGVLGIFIRSGASMVVMIEAQKVITCLGYRKL
jgi:solute carrier family 25 carnitine/acylcarnitine transporter 20/29